jgi:protein-L-isoaspartate(D-aspartate) O-methyltransferase
MRVFESNDELVDFVASRAPSYLGGGERDKRILAAMRLVDRASFLPPEGRRAAYADESAPIGHGQTCSQPSMVALMLDQLSIRPGMKILEVGAGCGYAAALLALLCAPGGRVTALEIQSELADLARSNCAVLTGSRAPGATGSVEVLEADGSGGLPSQGPFDRVLLSAGVSPEGFDEEPLLAQLTEGGILLYPEERGRLFRIERRGHFYLRASWDGVVFVPLLGKNS